ncbi:exosortase V [Sphingomonas quercus]|uniref:Exosortase V n=1 Tax=Sphingomonas quercus TaxID=2842451 RepID=A0ABS6BH88_9SPHN|nr:exosortase V [Sphingomonas quercus]MBU3077171.1 exosortase V [Sphingomonas quercus]
MSVGQVVRTESGVELPPHHGSRAGFSLLESVRRRPYLWVGLAAFVLPTMARVAQATWSSEQGAHGPIVLATGLWLIARQKDAVAAAVRPGNGRVMWLMLVPLLLLFTFARITSIIEIEGAAMYAAVVVVAYGLIGRRALAAIWFPLVYLLFIFPPPDTVFAMITQPLKIAVSRWVVDILHGVGYPIAGSGVSIQIGNYELLVAAACAGVYSLISLSAIGLFYTYVRHNSNWRYMLVLMVAIVPVAILANVIRAMALVLVTYHFGEAAGQGFFHEFAGLFMFTVALLSIFLIDLLGTPIRNRLAREGAEA